MFGAAGTQGEVAGRIPAAQLERGAVAHAEGVLFEGTVAHREVEVEDDRRFALDLDLSGCGIGRTGDGHIVLKLDERTRRGHGIAFPVLRVVPGAAVARAAPNYLRG